MSKCSNCGQPLQRTNSGMRRCPFCGTNYRPGSNKPILDVYVTQKKEKMEKAGIQEDLTSDQKIFISRVAQKLAPPNGLSGINLQNALKVQERYRQELRQVFLGKKDFNQWFDEKRTERGLHIYTMTNIIYGSLDGLTSKEAKSLREQYAEAISRLRTA